ncbi:amidohydrolase family protein [Novosphingobium sp.]|uniref:amidohydrolase family protein n=1 Tax=Novosphingobium sp. TaxID=1874826 RepID=UPI00261610D2|nr:amidohydrolase family protein [Novosphingobium sp.]
MSGTIDIHAHFVPADFPPGPPSCCAQWPGMVHHEDGRADVLIGDAPFRKIDHRSWDADVRIADMDAQSVALQALSPMPELLSYRLQPDETRALASHVNGAIAEMVARKPDRFAGLGMVPLHDPQMAAAMLAGMKADGLSGVEIGSNILGISPGDTRFDPFYAEAERLGMAVFVHALHPTMMDRLVGPKPPLAAFVGFPTDTGLAAASFITGRTLEKFPALRVAFSHGGGTFATLLPRLLNGWRIAPELQSAISDPIETARRMYYDNIVFDAELLKHIVHIFGETQVCAGSDYPYVAGQEWPGRPFDAFPNTTKRMLRHENARRFLGLIS